MKTYRKIWSLLHRWVGLAIAVFVVVSGLTGTAISFVRELDGWLNPTWYRVSPASTAALPLSMLVADAEARYPLAQVTGITLPNRPDASVLLSLGPRPGAGSLPINEVFFDPYRGIVLGERNTETVSVAPEHLMPFLYRVHYSLHLGETGDKVLGIVCLLWLVSMLVGVYLAWPARGKWKQVFSVKLSASAYRTFYDLHRAGGMLSAVVLVIVTWTGLWWNMNYAVRPAAAALLPTTPWYPSTLPTQPMPAQTIKPEEAIAAAQTARPEGVVQRIRASHEKGVYWVYLKRPGDVGVYGNTTVFISMISGAVLRISEPANQAAGDTYALWQFPLHTGQFLGLPGRIVWALCGLVPLLLVVSGVAVWLKKRRAEGGSKMRHKAGVPPRSITVAAVPLDQE